MAARVEGYGRDEYLDWAQRRNARRDNMTGVNPMPLGGEPEVVKRAFYKASQDPGFNSTTPFSPNRGMAFFNNLRQIIGGQVKQKIKGIEDIDTTSVREGYVGDPFNADLPAIDRRGTKLDPNEGTFSRFYNRADELDKIKQRKEIEKRNRKEMEEE